MYTIYICSHFGSILIQVETPCDKLGMTKGQFRLRLETYDQYKELIPFQHWYNKNKKNPIFRHLLAVAYRNWKVLVHINNKVAHLMSCMSLPSWSGGTRFLPPFDILHTFFLSAVPSEIPIIKTLPHSLLKRNNLLICNRRCFAAFSPSFSHELEGDKSAK